ncbi:DUF1990 domain-containing protein [Actinopolymorpha sp. B11F2]|uniref:DUF1990 family protein n=1 Tax=Actinopolymorpha sp. B11F2 TaxID=3160862 RepID=UPI0032E4C7CA
MHQTLRPCFGKTGGVWVMLRVPPLAELAEAEVTYPEVGATASELPAGYRHVVRRAELGHGDDVFERCGQAVLSWQLHRGAGLRVHPSHPVAQPDAVVAVVFGVGAIGVVAPCRVIYVVREENRRGFAYGTLAGHPESGEESFVVSRQADGSVVLEVTAFSRPANPLSRFGDPVIRRIQDWVTNRYVTATRRVALAAERPPR